MKKVMNEWEKKKERKLFSNKKNYTRKKEASAFLTEATNWMIPP